MGERRENERAGERDSGRCAAAFLPVLLLRPPRARMRRVFSGSGQPRRPPIAEKEGAGGGDVARQTDDRTQKILRRRQRELNGQEGGREAKGGSSTAEFGGQAGLDLDS